MVKEFMVIGVIVAFYLFALIVLGLVGFKTHTISKRGKVAKFFCALLFILGVLFALYRLGLIIMDNIEILPAG